MATPVSAATTQPAEQGPLPIDGATPDAQARPKLTCSADTTALHAPYPDTTWFCARADGTRHGAFVTLFPDLSIELEGSYKDGKLDGAWQRHYPNGAIAQSGTYIGGVRDGAWKHFDASGALLGEYKLDKGTGVERRWLADGPLYSEISVKAGVPHGSAKIFERNGTLLVALSFDNGVLDGKQLAGDKATLRAEETFVRGVRRGRRNIWQFWALIVDEAYDTRGRLHGAFTIWRGRGTKRVAGTYEHGKRIGTWTWTDRSNKTEREGDYDAGKKRGLWSEFVDGQLYFQGTYTDGKPDGDFVYYDKTGTELGRFAIAAGTGTMLTFHANGNLASKTQLVDGAMDGKHEELTPRGRTLIDGRYAKDQKHGTWREYSEYGVLLAEQRYKRGKLDGVWKKFAGGKLAVEATYKDGLAEGAYTEYHAGGAKAVVGQFAADKRTGTWTSYDASGSVTLTATYKDGVLEGPWRQLVGGVVVEGEMRAGHRTGTWTQTDRAGQKQSATYQAP
jgi:antitoxin component YwqK of YwqJK toxin-antitoxin module